MKAETGQEPQRNLLYSPGQIDFFADFGTDAREWIEEIHSDAIVPLQVLLSESLADLIRFQLPEARRALEELDAILAEPAGPSQRIKIPSLKHLLSRHRYTTRAYLHYLEGDLERALEDLDAAEQDMYQYLEQSSFLILFAVHSTDFNTQRARIARRENRWCDAQMLIEKLRRMHDGEEPYCTLPSGKAYYKDDLLAFIDSMPISEDERQRARSFVGPEISTATRLAFLEEMVFTLPDQVIPYIADQVM